MISTRPTIYPDKRALITSLIKPTDVVLDVGFWGQAIARHDPNWVHGILRERSKEVWELDLEYDESQVSDPRRYKHASAEDVSFDVKFDVILAADLIEHLSNPGLFLQSCARNLKDGGRLIITTPNCFNLFNIASKLTHTEPIANKDETCYFNQRMLRQLLQKNGWQVVEADYLYSIGIVFRESFKKRFLNIVYYLLSRRTPKFVETIVVTATRSN